jgi:hypothetical protein
MLKCVEPYLHFSIRLMVWCILQHTDKFTLNFCNAFILVSQYCSLPGVYTVQICKFISTFRINLMPHLQVWRNRIQPDAEMVRVRMWLDHVASFGGMRPIRTRGREQRA